jgi:hypothetical protein
MMTILITLNAIGVTYLMYQLFDWKYPHAVLANLFFASIQGVGTFMVLHPILNPKPKR